MAKYLCYALSLCEDGGMCILGRFICLDSGEAIAASPIFFRRGLDRRWRTTQIDWLFRKATLVSVDFLSIFGEPIEIYSAEDCLFRECVGKDKTCIE